MKKHTKSRETLTIGGLLSDFRVLLYLFLGFRLLMAMAYQPYEYKLYEADGKPVVLERGLSTFGDFRYFYQTAALSDNGDWPYRDFWYEYPPVWPGLFIGVYRIMRLGGGVPNYTGWATIVGLILAVVDVGNLVLVRRLGRRLHGEAVGVALSWVYAMLAVPLVLGWWTFDALVSFTILLALELLLDGRDRPSAVSTAIGMLAKYTPILILPTVWRFYDRKQATTYTITALVIVGVVIGVMLAWGGDMAAASLLAQPNKASYQTVWALLDGNMRTGIFPALETRFEADSAYKLNGNAPLIPPWLRLIPFAALGLYIFTRRLRQDDQGVVAFFTITVVLFFLWAQGWSPQWLVILLPLILLNFPTREGVLMGLVLGLVCFLEYPMLFMRTPHANGEISGSLVLPYGLVIMLRTGILVILSVALFQHLRAEPSQT